ncbi:MAG: ATP synthase F1 subunit delta [Ignavibacteria bacterium]|nr:ATP synthase F1 subunit delta [Ignavibacteria bacterium]
MKNVRVARRYAMALMSMAEELNRIDDTSRDLEVVNGILRDSREFRLLVASPIVSPSKKSAIFDALLGSRVSIETLIFVRLLALKHREALLQDVIDQFNVLRDERFGITNVDVKAALEFSPAQEKSLQGELERFTGKKVRLHFSLDKEIKGGLVVQVGDTVLDATIKHQLELLRACFVAG